MPLSPPLTPLPPTLSRFPSGLIPPTNPGAYGQNLQSLILAAAQCQPQLNRFPLPNQQDIMENLQRFLQFRQQQLAAGIQESSTKSSDKETDWTETDEEEANKSPMNNNTPKDILKQEEMMVEEEMKEEDDEKSAIAKRVAMVKEILNKLPTDSSRPNPFATGELPCKFNCGKIFGSVMELFQHMETCTKAADQDEDSVVSDGDQEDQMNSSNASSGGQFDERKVRVRTLISEEQLGVLKTFYMINPRPKREELEKIAAKIGHPFKVVKVWFQNSRARDRREGKPQLFPPLGFQLLNNNSFAPLARLPGLVAPAGSNSSEEEAKSPCSSTDEETSEPKRKGALPLDLSNKGSSPSSSPTPSAKDGGEKESHHQQPGSEQVKKALEDAAASAAAASSERGTLPKSPATASNDDVYRFQEEIDVCGTEQWTDNQKISSFLHFGFPFVSVRVCLLYIDRVVIISLRRWWLPRILSFAKDIKNTPNFSTFCRL